MGHGTVEQNPKVRIPKNVLLDYKGIYDRDSGYKICSLDDVVSKLEGVELNCVEVRDTFEVDRPRNFNRVYDFLKSRIRSSKSKILKMEQHPLEPMMKWFKYDRLPPHLQEVSVGFYDLAVGICDIVVPGPERTVALRKLLEAKDAAVRAKVVPHG